MSCKNNRVYDDPYTQSPGGGFFQETITDVRRGGMSTKDFVMWLTLLISIVALLKK